MITFKLAQNIVQPTPRESKLGFNYSQADWDGLYSYLLDTDFSTCLNSESIEFVWNTIKGTIHDAMHLFIPKRKTKKHHLPPWFSSDIHHRIKCLRTLRK